MKRAEWLEDIGQHEAADSARLWYEHFEPITPPDSTATAAEIDWALGTYAMWLRGRAAIERRDRARACALLPRVVELWENADPDFATLRDEAMELVTDLDCTR
jgi:hypothetical protein